MNSSSVSGSWKYVFKGQFQHLLMLAAMIPGYLLIALPETDRPFYASVTTSGLVYLLLYIVIAHQVIGWLVFRLQLSFNLLSRVFGNRDLMVWGLIFFPLFFLRPVFSIALGISDQGSLPGPRWLQIFVGIALLIPVFYTLWSVHKYFGIERALGGDHFRKEYRSMPLVCKGAFKYSSNAMYSFAFLVFWSIALIFGSVAALAAALFQHAYIWVHMYCTENPDLEVIYGTGEAAASPTEIEIKHVEQNSGGNA